MSEELPPGWASLPLGKLGTWRGGGTPSKRVREYWENGTVHWVSPKDMKRLLIDSAQDQITERAVAESATNLIPADSVLMVTRSGILEHSFPVAVNTVAVTLNQDMKAVTPHSGIDPMYTAYYLKARAQNILDECSKDGTTVSSIDTDALTAYKVALAPKAEQKRIVSKIDELFSRIDEGERALDQVSTLVGRYRQSVLKAAVTGELTRDWRDARRAAGHPVESGEALLTRILTARRKAWERAELAKMKVKGITPKNDAWKKKYKEPAPPDTTELSELPERWVWTSLGQLFQVSIGSTPSRKEPSYWDGGIPWVSSGEVAFCRISKTKENISKLGYDNSSVKLRPKGTVMLAMIGEGKTRGQAAILDIEACHNQNAASIGVSATPIPPEYIYYYLQYRYEIVRGTGQGGNQPALNGDLVKGIVIPLPPLEEISAICEVVERQFAIVAAFSTDLAAQDRLVGAQRQAILRGAFKGTLVAQDPTDEPASTLIERIAVERSKAKGAAVLKRGRKKMSA